MRQAWWCMKEVSHLGEWESIQWLRHLRLTLRLSVKRVTNQWRPQSGQHTCLNKACPCLTIWTLLKRYCCLVTVWRCVCVKQRVTYCSYHGWRLKSSYSWQRYEEGFKCAGIHWDLDIWELTHPLSLFLSVDMSIGFVLSINALWKCTVVGWGSLATSSTGPQLLNPTLTPVAI